MGERRWTVVIPVKPLATAKTRLRTGGLALPHEHLALAFVLDCATAVLACSAVAELIVVTDDPAAATALCEAGAVVVPDRPQAGLNAAARYGASLRTGPVAVLAGDLPALRTAELAAALDAAGAYPRSFVSDAHGTGTVLLAANDCPIDPRFGPGSAAAHAAAGAYPLNGAWPSLRLDVDTKADLVRAVTLGVGAHTRTVLAARNRYRCRMQGTVATFDERTRSGTVLLDDGREMAFSAAAFDASGLRLLRLGQRLRIECDEAGEISRVTLPTLP